MFRELSRLVDPLPDFLKEMDMNFQRLISNAGLRAFRGKLSIRVEFGRILIRNLNPNLVSTKDSRAELLDGGRLSELLRSLPSTGHVQATTRFTKKLTTVPDEIRYLVDMRKNDGSRLWKEQAHWGVTYEFIFKERSEFGGFFIAEMDAETFETVCTEPRDLGNIYTHGTKRAWDFRITAFAGERTESTQEKYSEIIKDLKRSLHVP